MKLNIDWKSAKLFFYGLLATVIMSLASCSGLRDFITDSF